MKRWSIILINLFIGVMSWSSWIHMLLTTRQGQALASAGVSSLKYFTVLSNLLNGVICLIFAVSVLCGRTCSAALKTWKLTGAVSVGLTFLTVMVFLGPLFGYGSMFKGANFWMHLVLPVLTMASFVLLEGGPALSLHATFPAVIPMALYAAGYVSNVLLHGIGSGYQTNDFYGFFHWGYGMAPVVAAVIFTATWLIALGLYAAQAKIG